jgi:hypothetical protein
MRSATVFEMALLKLVVERRKAKLKPLMKSALLMSGQKIIFPKVASAPSLTRMRSATVFEIVTLLIVEVTLKSSLNFVTSIKYLTNL